MDHRNSIFVGDGNLIDIRHLHAEVGELLNARHLEPEDMIKMPRHLLESQLDRKKERHSVVLLQLHLVLRQDRLICEVALGNKNA